MVCGELQAQLLEQLQDMLGYELQIEWQDLHCLLLMDLQLGCQLAMLLQQSGPIMM